VATTVAEAAMGEEVEGSTAEAGCGRAWGGRERRWSSQGTRWCGAKGEGGGGTWSGNSKAGEKRRALVGSDARSERGPMDSDTAKAGEGVGSYLFVWIFGRRALAVSLAMGRFRWHRAGENLAESLFTLPSSPSHSLLVSLWRRDLPEVMSHTEALQLLLEGRRQIYFIIPRGRRVKGLEEQTISGHRRVRGWGTMASGLMLERGGCVGGAGRAIMRIILLRCEHLERRLQ
jgi:hypothetical protein